MIVHQIKNVSSDKKNPRTTIETKCGLIVGKKSSAPQPPDMTIWRTDVSCPDCIGGRS